MRRYTSFVNSLNTPKTYDRPNLTLTTNMASLLERMNLPTNSLGPVRSKSNSNRRVAAPYVRGILLQLYEDSI